MIVSASVLRSTGIEALAAVATTQAAELQIDLLLDAELRGVPSHGFLRLPRIVKRIQNGVTDPASTGVHDWQREAFLAVDGGRGLGPVVAASAIGAMSERVRRTGIAVAAVRNSNHIGMLGYYVENAARNGQTMIALSTSEALVHPWGGRFAMLGTNPIAIGVPTGGEPFMMDAATSIVSMGEIHDRAMRRESIPDHWALDAEGNATTDAAAATAGSIAPFGEAKGYALGLGLELLVTSLARSAIGTAVKGTLDDVSVCNKGDVFILIDGPAVDLREYLQLLRDAAPAAGVDRVLVPGERGRALKAKRLVEGVPLDDGLWTRIQQLAETRH